MYQILINLCLMCALCCSAIAAEKDTYSAPSQLPRVRAVMLHPGFWIAQQSSPDDAVMPSDKIKAFNTAIRDELKLTKDIFALVGHFQTESLADVFKDHIENFMNKKYYRAEGSGESFLDKVKNNMHLNGVILGIAPKYGVIVHYANQRFLPTRLGLYAQKDDIDFDELQNSALDVGTPVAVVHQSRDGKWCYVMSELSDGWIEAGHVAIGEMQEVKTYAQPQHFIVITKAKADIFLDEQMSSFYDFVKMGNTFPLMEETSDAWIISLALRDKVGALEIVKGYIPKTQAHRGYLPYTRRIVLNQAFELLDKPYGWGDMYGQQDCSRFLQMVFATVGVHLPRDSKNQAQVGQELALFDEKLSNKDRIEALKNIPAATSILVLKGHIMLYLGMVDGVPYAIHATSGFTQTKGAIQIKYVLNRVAVTDLSLGESSAKGSLLRRLTKIIEIKL